MASAAAKLSGRTIDALCNKNVLPHPHCFSRWEAVRRRRRRRTTSARPNTEIKIGNIAPYSGPASSYATIAKTQAAYFKMINEAGGINGRKINFISYDDGYSPPKTVEQVRKLVESDEVFAIFQVIGTPRKYGDRRNT